MTETETDTRQVDCVLGEYMIWNWIKHEKKKKKKCFKQLWHNYLQVQWNIFL